MITELLVRAQQNIDVPPSLTPSALADDEDGGATNEWVSTIHNLLLNSIKGEEDELEELQDDSIQGFFAHTGKFFIHQRKKNLSLTLHRLCVCCCALSDEPRYRCIWWRR